MKLSDLMTPDPVAIPSDATQQQAAEKMRALDIGVLPVCDGDSLVGILTDRDLTVRAVAEGHDPRTSAVRDIMTTDLAVCYVDQEAAEAEQIMRERKVRRLVVLDRQQRLAGIVSLADLALRANERCGVELTLEAVSQPAA